MQALGAVHEKLYTVNHPTRVPLEGYLRELCEHLLDFHGLRADGIAFDWRASDITVAADTALHLGLIANEFVSNSLEHAFPERRGRITVALERVAPDRARLTLTDDGVGLPPGADRAGGLGLRMIALLARQVRGELGWEEGDGSRGTRLVLSFPL